MKSTGSEKTEASFSFSQRPGQMTIIVRMAPGFNTSKSKDFIFLNPQLTKFNLSFFIDDRPCISESFHYVKAKYY